MRRTPGTDDPARDDAWSTDPERPWLAVGAPAARALERGASSLPDGPGNGSHAILRVADVHAALSALGDTDVGGCLVSADLLDARPRAALRSLRRRLRAAPLWIIDPDRAPDARAAAAELGISVWGDGRTPDGEPPEAAPARPAPAEAASPLPRADEDPPQPGLVDPGRFAEGCLERMGSVSTLVRYILRTLTEASNASRVTLMLRDPERDTLRLREGRGINESLLGKVRCSVGIGIAGRVAAFGRPVTGHGSTGGPRKYHASAFVVLPLGNASRCEGVINLTGLPANALPDAETLRTWTRMSRRAGLALRTARRLHAARALSTRDALTGLPNRRAFERALRRESERARRAGTPLVVALMDVDHFKAFNDRYGHQAGDRVLVEVGARLEKAFRETDLVARWGGEEFAVLLPGVAGREAGEARRALERARRAVGGRPFALGPGVPPMRVTISGGMAAFPAQGDGGDELVRAADEALYRAKEAGRDRIEPA